MLLIKKNWYYCVFVNIINLEFTQVFFQKSQTINTDGIVCARFIIKWNYYDDLKDEIVQFHDYFIKL